MSSQILGRVTADSLAKGEFRSVIPEYYQLTRFVENSLWHIHQSVFDHSVKVMRGFERVIQFDFLPPDTRLKATAYFQQEIAGMSRYDQLKTVVLLHDIAKPLVFKENPDGTAGCLPLHEALGAAMVDDFSGRLELTDAQTARVKQMILLHGTISEILNVSLAHPGDLSYLRLFERLTDGCTNELLCFIYSDILGSDLETSLPQAFQDRITLLNTWLSERFTLHE